MQAETSSVLQLNGQHTCSIGKSNKLIIYHAGIKLIGIRRTKHPTSDYPAPIQWLTFPLIHSCSCCPQWTHGWLDGQSGWAFRQPVQFLCSFGWLLWVSDHLHLRTKREKRQSAIVPRAFRSDRLKEKQRRSFRRSAWHLAARQYFALAPHFVTQPCFISSSRSPLEQT